MERLIHPAAGKIVSDRLRMALKVLQGFGEEGERPSQQRIDIADAHVAMALDLIRLYEKDSYDLYTTSDTSEGSK